MGLQNALYASVSALNAQSNAVSVISTNVSNTSTTAYKTQNVDFQALVNGTGTAATGGVLSRNSANLTQQGDIKATSLSTNIALNGGGLFVVTSAPTNGSGAYNFSRNGNFQTDAQGYLVNDEGQYLLGQKTDNTGKVVATNPNDLNSLTPVDLSAVKGLANATANLKITANLPADSTVGQAYTTSTEVYDSLGVSSSITQTWTKTGTNSWTLGLSNPTLTSNPAITSGTISPASIALTFNGDGSLASTAPSPTTLSITNFTTGASNSSIALNLGTIGTTDGLTQYTSETSGEGVQIGKISQDGVRYGALSSVSISSAGIVTAKFDNGLKTPLYQLPIATFPNENGLTHEQGSIYSSSAEAGTVVLRDPGVGNAGTLSSSALEQSTTDTSTQLSDMVVAQQAYSASAKLITTVSTMYNALIQAVQ